MGGQLSLVGQKWAGESDFPNADLGFCLLDGLEAAGKGGAQNGRWGLLTGYDLGTGTIIGAKEGERRESIWGCCCLGRFRR